jgi:uncharacterized protein
MKIVLDTNVLFAAFAARGLVHSVFELCLENHTIIISKHILDELARHLREKLNLPQDTVLQISSFLRDACKVATEAPVDASLCRDKDDLKILGLAEKAAADVIISGDEDLLILGSFHSIPIWTPRQFWESARRPQKTGVAANIHKKPKCINERRR